MPKELAQQLGPRAQAHLLQEWCLCVRCWSVQISGGTALRVSGARHGDTGPGAVVAQCSFPHYGPGLCERRDS